MDKHKLILPVSIILGCIILGGFYYASQLNKQSSIEKQPHKDLQEKQIEQKNIKVETIFYISCSDSQCLIPKASGLPADDQMICLWNYTAGNGSIPWLEETKGWLPSISIDNPVDLSVLCRDTNGIIYFGKEGEKRK
ncbi:MAG: hypothetical protein Q7S77_00715 [Candidatus Staskawiczbacteria bacterium]|nr:hypothetical protein [Candidatus Staskawiczbacteria bacterium]